MMLTLGKGYGFRGRSGLRQVRMSVGGVHPHAQTYWTAAKGTQTSKQAHDAFGKWADTLAAERNVNLKEFALGQLGKKLDEAVTAGHLTADEAAQYRVRAAGALGKAQAVAAVHAAGRANLHPVKKPVGGKHPHTQTYWEADRNAKLFIVNAIHKMANEKAEKARRVRGMILVQAVKNAVRDGKLGRSAGDRLQALVAKNLPDASEAIEVLRPDGESAPPDTVGTDLNNLVKDREVRSGLAMLLAGLDRMALTQSQVAKLHKYGLMDDDDSLNVYGSQILGTFKEWVSRQSHNLENLVGDGRTRKADYYTPEGVEAALAEGTPLTVKPIDPGEAGVNLTFKAVIKGLDGKKYTGAFKPKSGEADERPGAVDVGTLYRRERAAYEIDQMFGFDLVPPTVIRTMPGKKGGEVGSVQEWKEGDCAYLIDRWEDLVDHGELQRLAVLDYVTGNMDRHEGNFIVDSTYPSTKAKLWAIDNGYSIPDDSDLLGAYYKSDVHNIVQNLKLLKLRSPALKALKAVDQAHLRARMQRLGITDEAVHGLLARLNQVITMGKLPEYKEL
jgi:hypothetical protein